MKQKNTLNPLSKIIPVMSLDSKIEKVFYRKCVADFSSTGLLLEWANSKDFYCRYTRLTFSDYGNYSKHDSSHSVYILEAIHSVIGKKRIEKLNVMDLWLLLHCAYSHDIGMSYTDEDAHIIWKIIDKDAEFKVFLQDSLYSEDNDLKLATEYVLGCLCKLSKEMKEQFPKVKESESLPTDGIVTLNKYYRYITSEYIRKRHARRTAELFLSNKELQIFNSSFTIESRFYGYVARCSLLHGESFNEVMQLNRKEWHKEGECHPAFIAAMLRLGDLLDIDNNRFDLLVLKHYGDLPENSKIHKKKHESITHISYKRDGIEITSECDQIEVCNCTADWFRYIRDEVENIIFNWSKIAPKCLGGCEMSLPKMEIFYNGKEFHGLNNQKFEINQNMLIELVIGKNLYRSKIDFIKEYIQNSMDALKMKFWIDIAEGRLDHLVKEQYREFASKMPKEEWIPFYFEKAAFQQYRLEIICRLKEKENSLNANQKDSIIEIEIKDHGIGIDKECVEAISHIGSGWKKRRNYKRYLGDMAEWLKPTGGFGIGMQSGFMISDKIEILTRCADDTKGRKITLHSSAKDGRIEEQECDVNFLGTSILVEIPFMWFMDSDNVSQYNILEYNRENSDCFDKKEVLKIIYKMICNYSKLIVGNPLFPITLKCPNLKDIVIDNIYGEDLRQNYCIPNYKENYSMFRFKRGTCIWNKKECVLCIIEPRKTDSIPTLKWYYKGVRVWEEMKKIEEILAKCIGDISIDIMTADVTNCLTVDRNKFTAGFDYIKKINDFLEVYFNGIKDTLDLYSIMKTKYPEYSAQLNNGDTEQQGISEKLKFTVKEDYYCLILAYRYMKGDTKKIFAEKIYDMEDSEVSADLFVNYIKEDNFSSEQVLDTPEEKKAYYNKKIQVISLLNICKSIWKENDVYVICEEAIENKIVEENIKKKIKDFGEIVVSSDLYYILENFEGQIKYTDIGNEFKLLGYHKKQEEKEEEKTLMFKGSFSGENRNILFSSTHYKELHVSSLPLTMSKYLERNQDSEKNMIISPIPPMLYDEGLLQSILVDADDREKVFLSYIMNGDSFKLLVDWVYEHQIIPFKYTKEQVTEQYKELLKDIFQIKFETGWK